MNKREALLLTDEDVCVALGSVISNLYIIQTNNLQLLVCMNGIQTRRSKMSTNICSCSFFMFRIFQYDREVRRKAQRVPLHKHSTTKWA